MTRRLLPVRQIAGFLAVLALPIFAPLGSSRAASPLVGPFRTSGNQILDGTGAPVIFRGTNIARLSEDPSIDVPNLTEESMDAKVLWGVNQIRLMLGQQFWLANECKYQPAYRSNVDTIVNRMTSRGMMVMISLGRVTRKPCGVPDNAKMADQGSLEFWRQVAERYKNNPLVSFDLFNEPHDIEWSVWENGGTITDNSVTYKAAGMQQMYNAVRATGAQNLIYVSGNHWASKPPGSTSLLSGFNIVYAKHSYTCTVSPPPNCNKPNPYNPAPPGKRLSQWLPLMAWLPVQITEFGWPSQMDGTYNRNVVEWAEDHGIGWLAYAWQADDKYSLLTDWTTYRATVSGKPIADGLLNN